MVTSLHPFFDFNGIRDGRLPHGRTSHFASRGFEETLAASQTHHAHMGSWALRPRPLMPRG